MDQHSRSGSYARIGRSYPRPQPAGLAPKPPSPLGRFAVRVSALIRRFRSR